MAPTASMRFGAQTQTKHRMSSNSLNPLICWQPHKLAVCWFFGCWFWHVFSTHLQHRIVFTSPKNATNNSSEIVAAPLRMFNSRKKAINEHSRKSFSATDDNKCFTLVLNHSLRSVFASSICILRIFSVLWPNSANHSAIDLLYAIHCALCEKNAVHLNRITHLFHLPIKPLFRANKIKNG